MIKIDLLQPCHETLAELAGFEQICFALPQNMAELIRASDKRLTQYDDITTLYQFTQKISLLSFLNSRFELITTPINVKQALYVSHLTSKETVARYKKDASCAVIMLCLPKFDQDILTSDLPIFLNIGLKEILNHLPRSITKINVNWVGLTQDNPIILPCSTKLMNKICSELDLKNKGLSKHSAEVKRKLKKLNARISFLENDLDQLRKKDSVQNEELKVRQEKIESKEEAAKLMEEALEELEQKAIEMAKRCENKDSQFKELEKKLDASLHENQTLLKSSTDNQLKLLEFIQSLSEQTNHLRKQLEIAKTNFDIQLQSNSAQVSGMKQYIAGIENELIAKQVALNAVVECNQLQRDEVYAANIRIYETITEMETLQEALQKEKSSTSKQSTEEKSQLDGKIDELENHCKRLRATRDEISHLKRKQEDQFHKVKIDLERKLSELKHCLKDAKNKMGKIEEQKVELQHRLSDADKKVDEGCSTIMMLKQLNSEEKLKFQTAESRLAEKEEELNALKRNYETMSNKLQESEQEKQQYQIKNTENCKLISGLERENESLKEKSDRNKNQCKQIIRKLTNENKALKDELNKKRPQKKKRKVSPQRPIDYSASNHGVFYAPAAGQDGQLLTERYDPNNYVGTVALGV
jgi:chromosome segregation ATPase